MDPILKQRRTWKRACVKKSATPLKENTDQKIQKIIYQGKSALSIIYKSQMHLKNLTFIKSATEFLEEKGLPFSRLIFFENTKNGYNSIWTLKEGKIKSNWTTLEYKAFGSFLGKMHLISKNYKESILYSPPVILSLKDEYENIKEFLPSCFDSIYPLLKKIEERWPLFLSTGIVHTDLFPKNILFDKGKVSGILQNHKMQIDVLLYDLTSIIKSIYFTNVENMKENEEAFFSSYCKYQNLDQSEFYAIPVLTAAKFLHTAIFLIKKHLSSVEFTHAHLNAAAISLIHAEKALHLFE